MRIVLLRIILRILGYGLAPKYSGYEVRTSWPDQRFVKQVVRLRLLFDWLLPKQYFYTEPMITSEQYLVVYVWHRQDPCAKAFIKQNNFMFGAYRDSAPW